MLVQASAVANQVANAAPDAASEWEEPTILNMAGEKTEGQAEPAGDTGELSLAELRGEEEDETGPVEDPPPDPITTREVDPTDAEKAAGLDAVAEKFEVVATSDAAPQETATETASAASDTLVLQGHAPPRSVTRAWFERESMIRDSQEAIGELAREIARAKAHLKDVNKAFNKEVEHLEKLVGKPVEALPIIDRIEARENEAESPRATASARAVSSAVAPVPQEPSAPPVDVNAWRKRPISELGLRSSVEEKLLGAGLDTMGVLEDRRAEVYSGREKWPKGIGKQKVTMIEDAIMEWLSANRDGGVLASAMTPQPRADVPTTEGRLTTVGGLVEEAMFKAEAEKSAEDPADAADSNPADSAAEAAGSTGKGEEPKQGDPNEVVGWIEIPLSFGSAKIAAEEFDDNKWRISWEVDFPGFGGSSWTAHPDHVPINTRANALVGAASKVWNEVSKALNAAIKAGSPQQLLTGLQAMRAEAFEFLSKAGSL